MDLKKIEYFLCSAESLNFSHAAKQLYISQQALSRQIQMLEQEWGEKLFERTNTGLALTEVGRKACEIFRPLVSGLYRGEEELQTFIKYKQQVIRFAYFSSIPYSEIILPMVTEMQRLNPEVSIRMLDLPACYAHKAEIILAYKKLHPLRELFEQMKKAAGMLEHTGK